MLLLLFGQASATPLFGVDYMPMGRADLVWTQSDQPTGTFVGEFDGLLNPPLTAYGGLQREQYTWLLGLTAARTSTTNWTAESRRRVTVTGIRPTLDVQRYLLDKEGPTFWVGGGLYGVLPIARDVNEAYGEEEQEAAREGSRELMARVGGVGARVGCGAEVAISEQLTLGLRTHIWGFRGQRFTEDALLISTLISADAGVRLQIAF